MAKYLNLAGLQTLWAKLKDTFAPKTHTHNFTEVQEPIAEKTYTGLIASSNTNGNGADFIMIDLAHVSDTSKIFKLRVRIEASYKRSDDNVTYTSTHDCLIYGAGGNGTICSAMWNNHRNTSYRPMYYFVAYRPSTATANWKLGVCLYNCNNNTTAGNERTITMKVISQENCSATLYDSCANTDYTTYYKNMAARTTYDCANNGLQERGDANSTTNVYAKDITGYSSTAAGTAAKAIDFAQFVYTGSRVFKAYIANANTAKTPTINVNGQGAKTLYLLTADNVWTAASSTVKTITAGSHWFFWNGTYMYMLPDVCNSSAIPTDVAFINGQASYATKNVFVNGAYLVKGIHFKLRVDVANTNTGNLSLNVNCQGAKPLFIDGVRANGTNKNMGLGWYEVVYDGINYNAYSAAGGGIVYPEADHASSASAAKSGSALETAINGKADAASVTGATKCKVTYNSQGVVTAGADLAASDIPSLAASKITSGTFADERIASASKWNAKQDALTSQTPYSDKGSATKVPKITTNALGQVTDITEVDIDQLTIVQDLRVAYDDPTDVARAQSVVPSQYAVGYYTIEELKKIDDKKLDKEDAADTYLTKEDAGTSYITRRYASDYYLTKEDAADTYLKKTDPSAGVTDWGNNEYKVLCGYKGGSIAEVAPGLNPGEPKSSGSEYLVSVFHNETAKTSYYKDVKASNVTVGKALADGDGNVIADTYFKTSGNVFGSNYKYGFMTSPIVIFFGDELASSVSINTVVRNYAGSSRKVTGRIFEIVNVSASAKTLTGFYSSATSLTGTSYSLPAGRTVRCVYYDKVPTSTTQYPVSGLSSSFFVLMSDKT